MRCIFAIRDRVQAAVGLPAVLDATYVAFEEMLTVIHAHQNPGSTMFVPFMMAAAHAAGGRDAVLFAPSLPPRPLRPAPAQGAGEWAEPLVAARELAALCELVEARLTQEAAKAAGQHDRSACLDAAAQARGLRDYFSGSTR
jgi:hypothetical protein